MTASSKSLFSFLAGAATVAAASVFLKSKSGLKVRKSLANSLSQSLKNARNKTNENFNSEWFNDLGDSALDSMRKFKSKVKF
jgi:gas vesicle protein